MDVASSPSEGYSRLKKGMRESSIVESWAELDAVLISHAHLDHVGLLPALHADPDLPRVRTSSGLHAQIPFYASEETRALARIMLKDAVQVAKKTGNGIYSAADVSSALADLRPPKDGMLHLFRDLGHVELIESGHILGSRMILLEKDGLRVLYTGDLNTRSQLVSAAAPTLRDLQPEVLIIESTYGYEKSEWMLPRTWQEQIFVTQLDRVLRRGGVVLLPTFAVGRSQEVLGLVASHAQQHSDLSYGIYMDGLSRTVTRCYDRNVAHLPKRYQRLRQSIDHRLTMVPENVRRESLIRTRILGRPNVIIASSGMLKQGSTSYEYAIHIASDPRNAIFYTGYLAEDSEAIAFLDGDRERAGDLNISCEQRRFDFSAHAPQEDLLQFVLNVRPQVVILVHGDASRRGMVQNNLYDQLLRLESDSFRVFLGQEGRQIEYRQRRYDQI
jgi:Cft2 family RNA processing exonuclease